jgi:hypothetical protein
LAAAGLRLAAAVGEFRHANTPRAQGFRNYGTFEGTSFWLLGRSSGSFSLRTTGKDGGCTYNGPDLQRLGRVFGGALGYLPVCVTGGLRGTRLAVYLVPDSFGPVRVTMSDGTSVPQTGAIDPGSVDAQLMPGERLEIVVINGVHGVITTTAFG